MPDGPGDKDDARIETVPVYLNYPTESRLELVEPVRTPLLTRERGAAWDSGDRWTGFAVWAAPVAGAMTSGGVMFCLRALHVWSP